MFGRKAKIVYSVILIFLILLWEYINFYYIYSSYNGNKRTLELGFDLYSTVHLFPVLGLIGFIFLPKYIKFSYPIILFFILILIQYSPLHKSCNIYSGFFSSGDKRCECFGTISKFERVMAFDAGHVDYCVGIIKRDYEFNSDSFEDLDR